MWEKEEIQVAEWNQPYHIDTAEFPTCNLCEQCSTILWGQKNTGNTLETIFHCLTHWNFQQLFSTKKYKIINLDVLSVAFGTFFIDAIMSTHIRSKMEDEQFTV